MKRQLAAVFLITMCSLSTAQVNERTELLVRQISAITDPVLDLRRLVDASYYRTYITQLREAFHRRGKLIFTLFREEPEHPALFELLSRRWQQLDLLGDTDEQVTAALNDGILETENLLLPPAKLNGATLWPQDDWHQLCRYWQARLKIRVNRGNWAAQKEAAISYIQEVPGYISSHSDILLQAAFQAPSPKQAAEAYRMIVEKYPEDHIVPTVKGFLKRIEGVGQPASFSLIDAKTKKEVKTQSYKGKVLVLDFFRLEPEKLNTRVETLKELKAAHPQDLVIISVCLDMASGNAAKTLEAKVLDWAQQAKVDWIVSVPGEKAQPDFLTAWHIAALPEAFIINKEGLLVKLGFGFDLSREVGSLLKP